MECPKAREAGALSLLLPTVFLNGPFLGQCDGLWVGCCLLAVAAAIERKTYAMAAWAGLAFAFKAQAAFLAPFCLVVVKRERRWATMLIPSAVYLLAMLPAWLAGWPLSNLLTVYVRQYEYLDWLSKGPNIWALPQMLGGSGAWLSAAHIVTLAAVSAYMWRPPKSLLVAALLSALILPFFLPRMHERYFLLADLLAFSFAYVDRRGAPIFLTVQAASLLSLLTYATNVPALNVAGGALMAIALVMVVRLGYGRSAIRSPSFGDDARGDRAMRQSPACCC
jgi:Gpi18-like mannosyltransferase